MEHQDIISPGEETQRKLQFWKHAGYYMPILPIHTIVQAG